jgi:hypothetical protein
VRERTFHLTEIWKALPRISNPLNMCYEELEQIIRDWSSKETGDENPSRRKKAKHHNTESSSFLPV